MGIDDSTIKLSKKTKKRLDHLKEYKRETYEEIVQKLLGILNICRTDPDRAQDRLVGIDRAVKMKEREIGRDKVRGKIERFR